MASGQHSVFCIILSVVTDCDMIRDWAQVVKIIWVCGNLKMMDIGFRQIEPNRTDLKIQETKTLFLQFGVQKPTSVVWERFFSLSHSQFIF